MNKAFCLALVLSACGGGGGDGDDVPADTAQQQSTIEVVTPCTGETATVNTLATRFDPKDTTITAGQIVKFISDSTHPIAPSIGGDAALNVPEGATKCLKFKEAGTFNIRCTVHGYTGSIVVQ